MELIQVNRLYWITEDGEWELVAEDKNEYNIMNIAGERVRISKHGLCGYAKYAYGPKTTYWTRYVRHEGGSSRAIRTIDQLPKEIQFMELLNE